MKFPGTSLWIGLFGASFIAVGAGNLRGAVAVVPQTEPVVAIHDSELTRALETLPAASFTPTGSDTTGFQWWPTNWHYFVMPESVKEALRSDGTAYEVVSDEDISEGRLLASNGQPRCPIVISLAAEAIRDDEVAPLTNYVAAGGTLFIGSSSFTRNIDGSTRGDFALSDAMGIHMVNADLVNWTENATFSKTSDDGLVAHIPDGVLQWQMPTAADEIPWSISPTHPLAGPHPIWEVQASGATVIAQGDEYPYLTVKKYGKGTIIYCAAMQPLLGNGGNAPGTYAYGIFRNAIERAFACSRIPLAKLSPWPYGYDAALTIRHDLENYRPLISNIESSAQYEATNGLRGDYYFCTGTLRVEMTNSPAVIAGLRSAVSNYGATIGSHNGGLRNPNNPSLVASNYDYWHWGPDEALDATPEGYTNGKAYAFSSISNSFADIEGWLAGLTNGFRSWVGCYFNSVREDSYDILEQLGVKTVGEQKLGPFPHWTLSTRNSGERYPFVALPVSDWFIGSQVAQALESGHSVSSMQNAVDYYYRIGGLINLYSHSLSDGSGQAGHLLQQYISYSLGKPRVWSTNALGIYSWWTQRSGAQVTPTYTTDGNEGVVTLSVTGATDSRTAAEIMVSQTAFYNVEVYTNGVSASGDAYSIRGQAVKLLVGTTVTNAEIRYTLAPRVQDDLYSVSQGAALVVPAPGVLSNDTAGLGAPLSAAVVAAPAHGTLNLNTNGGFSYQPDTDFAGVDTFSYLVDDGSTNAGPATVTVVVTPGEALFSDDFARAPNADPLLPWQVAAGTWQITNGLMQGSGSPFDYGFAYTTNTWGDYWVQARVQFPEGAYGGGIGGRLDPLTGAHYAAWIYPEGSSGGSNVLKLVKFRDWSTFGYKDQAFTSMQEVSLPTVGTNWHTIRLAFHGSRIAVYFDGVQVISLTDEEPVAYTSGGVSLDMWNDSSSYDMAIDDIAAGPLVLSDSYAGYENMPLIVPAPGPLANDTAVYGTNLQIAVTRGATNGTLNVTADGGFSYVPATNFAGADSFVYEAHDGDTNLGAGTVSITVRPAIIVTADNQTRTYGASNPPLTGTVVGLLNGDNITATFSTTADASSPVGAYPISFSLQDPDGKLASYFVITNTGTVSVTPAALSVVPDDTERSYGAANPPLTGIVAGIQNGDDITATYSTSANETSSIGTYPILPALTDPSGKLGNYTVTGINGTLTVTAASLAVTASSASRVYGASNPVFSGSVDGVLNGDGIIASYGTDATITSPVGTYAIAPALIDPNGRLGNYTVHSTNGTLSVTAAALTVTAHDASRVYGVTNPVFTGSVTGILNGDNLVPAYSTPASTNSPIGHYPITGSFQDPDGKLGNYAVTSVAGNLTIVPAALSIAADPQSKWYGRPDPVLTYRVTSGKLMNGDTPTGVLSRVTGENAGPYAIEQGSLSVGTNYILTFQGSILTIAPTWLIARANDQSRVYGATNPVFTISYSGFVNGEAVSALTELPVASTVAQLDSPIGSYEIALSGGSATNYSLILQSGSLSIAPAALNVVADNAYRSYGSENPTLSGRLAGARDGDGIFATYATTATTNSAIGSYPIIPTLVDPNSKLGNYSVSSSNGTLTVSAAVLSVVADDTSRTYGATNPVFTGTITGLQNGDSITAIYASGATVASPVGAYPITPALVDPSGKLANYSVVVSNGILDVLPAALSVVANDASRTYGATNPSFSGIITGLQNNDNVSATYAADATVVSPVGTYSITPTLADPEGKLANYTVSSADGTLTVDPALLIGTADARSRFYGETNPLFTATYSGFVNGQDSSILSGSLSGTCPADTNSPIGSYGITVSGQSAPNYTVQYVDGTLTVLPAALLVQANDASRAYGQSNPVFTASFSGWVNGEDTNVLDGVLAFSTPAQTNSPVGTYPIVPEGLSATNYSLNFSNGTLTVAAYALSLVASNQSRAYGQPNPVLTGSLSGLQNGDNITPVYTTAADTNSPVGSYAIVAALVDPNDKLANYAVTTNNASLTVEPALLTVSADAQTKSYGQTDPALTYQITGGALMNGDALTGELSRVAGEDVGIYAILQGSLAAGTNYTLTYAATNLTILPASLIAKADDQSRVYGASNPPFSVSYSGFVNGESASALAELPVASTPAQADSPVGSYEISLTGGSAANYSIVLQPGSLSITPAAISVLANNASRPYGADNSSFSGSLSGILTGVREGDDISAVYTTTASTNSPVGAYPIIPTLVDPNGKLGNYTISSSNGTLNVTAAVLSVAAGDASRVYGDANPVFTGTITGVLNNDDISATYASAAAASSPVGTYAITPTLVDPNGKLANYTVSSADGTLTVTAAPLSVAADNASRTYGATNPAFTGTVTGLRNSDDISATYACAATVGSSVGTYPITPSLVDPEGKLANYSVSSADGTLTVNPALLTGTADTKSRFYGETNPVFTVTYTGFVNGQDASILTGLLSAACVAATNSPVGSYAVTVSGQSAPNYTVQYVDGVLMVVPAPLRVQADDASRAYGQTNPVFTASFSGWVNGEGTNVLDGVLTVSSPAQTNSPVGTYPIVPAGLSATNYSLNFSNGKLTVAAYALSVSASNQSRSYGQPNPVLTGSLSGLQNGDNITPVYSTAADTNSSIGMYPIIATLLDPDHKLANYAVTTNNASLTVNPAAITVTADAQTKWYGQPDPVLTYRVTSGSLMNGDAMQGALNRSVGENAGSYAIGQGSLTAGTNYTVSYQGSLLTIAPTWLIAQADDQSRVYGAANPVFSIRYNGFVNGEGVGNLSQLPKASTGASNSSPVGNYEISVSGGSASNYAIIPLSGTLHVTPAALTVTANSTMRAYGSANPILRGSITGVQNGDNITATYATTATTNSAVGGYPITPTLADPAGKLGNYTVTKNNGTMLINPAALSVTASNATRFFGVPNPTFTGTISGVRNNDNITATYSTSATSSSPAGTYSIVPSLADPNQKLGNYTVTINNGTLTITGVTAPRILSLVPAGSGNMVVTWESVTNGLYRVQYSTNLATTNWLNLTPDKTATGNTASFTDSPNGVSQRYYRVLLLPN